MVLPKNFRGLVATYPEVGKAYQVLAEGCYEAGPLDRKTAHLIKLGMSIASHSEGSTHTHVRLAKENGATDDEIRHVALLALTTLGWPLLGAAWSWVNDMLE
ncbi:MAG: carboxymuconolactone decarboxylase family protein [Candidatus Hydrothermarchaeaceae archaeon]